MKKLIGIYLGAALLAAPISMDAMQKTQEVRRFQIKTKHVVGAVVVAGVVYVAWNAPAYARAALARVWGTIGLATAQAQAAHGERIGDLEDGVGRVEDGVGRVEEEQVVHGRQLEEIQGGIVEARAELAQLGAADAQRAEQLRIQLTRLEQALAAVRTAQERGFEQAGRDRTDLHDEAVRIQEELGTLRGELGGIREQVRQMGEGMKTGFETVVQMLARKQKDDEEDDKGGQGRSYLGSILGGAR